MRSSKRERRYPACCRATSLSRGLQAVSDPQQSPCAGRRVDGTGDIDPRGTAGPSAVCANARRSKPKRLDRARLPVAECCSAD